MTDITIFSVPNWVLWAFSIGAVFSLSLNGTKFLPWFSDLRPSRIEARWVGYIGLTMALWLWIILNPAESATNTGIAWVIINMVTLIPNTMIHLHRRDNGSRNGGWGLMGKNRRPNNHSRLLDLLLDIKAERLQAQEALAAQDEMLQSLYAIFDPSGARNEREK